MAMTSKTSVSLARARPAGIQTSQKARPVARSTRSVRVLAASLADTAAANGCSKFADALRSTGLDSQTTTGNFTMFAPNDAAFDSMSNPKNIALVEIIK